MTTQLLLAYGLGAAASLAAVLILIPFEPAQLHQGGARKALAALALAAPTLMLLALGSAGPADNNDTDLLAAAVATNAGGMKQDADWGMISHMYLGGPPPDSTARPADAGAATARAQRSAAELAAITTREPANVEAWLALAQAHRTAREYPAAIAAYAKALKLDAGNADAWADYADAMASANSRKLTGPPATAVARALKLDPTHLKGLWLQASLDLEQRRYKDALMHWQKLRAALPPASPDITVIDANIAEAQQLAARPEGGA